MINTISSEASELLNSFGVNYLNKNFKVFSAEETLDVVSITIEKLLNNERFITNLKNRYQKRSVLSYYSKSLKSEAIRLLKKQKAEQKKLSNFELIAEKKTVSDPFYFAAYSEMIEKSEKFVLQFVNAYKKKEHLSFCYYKFDRGLKLREISILTDAPLTTISSAVQSVIASLKSFLVINGITDNTSVKIVLYKFFKIISNKSNYISLNPNKIA